MLVKCDGVKKRTSSQLRLQKESASVCRTSNQYIRKCCTSQQKNCENKGMNPHRCRSQKKSCEVAMLCSRPVSLPHHPPQRASRIDIKILTPKWIMTEDITINVYWKGQGTFTWPEPKACTVEDPQWGQTQTLCSAQNGSRCSSKMRKRGLAFLDDLELMG
jgi:hypothetical protein